MTKASFLLSPPDFFGVEYVINPWMKNNINQVNSALAKKQWQAFHDELQQYADIQLVEPRPKLPDLVFTANAALIFNKTAILSHFRHPERQGEEKFFRDWFLDHGFEVFEFPEDVYFEGAGDALFQPNQKLLWLAHGFRSDPLAKEYIEKIVDADVKIVTLQLTNDRFYHLDTCFCPLEDGYVMYYPGAFSDQTVKMIRDIVPEEKRIEISEHDAALFACNAVEIPIKGQPRKRGIIIFNDASEALVTRLQTLGYQVIKTPTSEYLKSGGATKCLSLRLA